MKGKFITIEGIEGVGKSTNLQTIERTLAARKIPCAVTREPGGTPLAEKIREILLAPSSEPMSVLAELLLVFAARAQHVEALIRPKIEAGTWVVCDRFTDSTYAYQGGGRGIDPAIIASIEQVALDGFEPDLTILLDLPVETSARRARERGEADRFEGEDARFFEKVRLAFLDRARGNPRFVLIDASQDIETVGTCVADAITRLIEQ
ncbi:MAG: dTMP kinase [Pseudomonadales bacterium]|nr:dTMP kinase [Pseudomonadales bacterium]